MPYTYVTLELSNLAFVEVKLKLQAAGYEHAINEKGDVPIIDMNGLAVTPAEPSTVEEPLSTNWTLEGIEEHRKLVEQHPHVKLPSKDLGGLLDLAQLTLQITTINRQD